MSDTSETSDRSDSFRLELSGLVGSKEAVNMLEQGRSGRSGRCVFAADDSGRVLDRLAGLEKVISTEAVRQSLKATGRVGQRSAKLTHEIVLWSCWLWAS